MSSEPTVYLISCVKTKQSFPCPAKDLYISELFSKARNYAETLSTPWFILSAKYGLLPPEQIVEPYERTLNKMRKGEREAWAQRVLLQIETKLPTIRRVVFLAGSKYREGLIPALSARGIEVCIPMEGLGIGRQLGWLKRQSDAAWYKGPS